MHCQCGATSPLLNLSISTPNSCVPPSSESLNRQQVSDLPFSDPSRPSVHRKLQQLLEGADLFYPTLNIERSENSRTKEANELLQMFLPHGAQLPSEHWWLPACLVGKVRSIGALSTSPDWCDAPWWGNETIKNTITHLLLFLLLSLSVCSAPSSSFRSLPLSSVSLTLSAPEARAWWQL